VPTAAPNATALPGLMSVGPKTDDVHAGFAKSAGLIHPTVRLVCTLTSPLLTLLPHKLRILAMSVSGDVCLLAYFTRVRPYSQVRTSDTSVPCFAEVLGRLACSATCYECDLLLRMSHVLWFLCLSVCALGTRMSCAKTAELIDMPFSED